MKYAVTIFALFIALQLHSSTYFIDKNGVHGTVGDDSNSGLSWDQPWATISKAAQILDAGDSVIIAKAVYREQLEPQNSGSFNDPIYYIGEDSVTVSAFDPISKHVSYSEIHKVPKYDYVYYFIVPASIQEKAGPLADMAKINDTRRINVVTHNGSMSYHRWIKGISHGSKHGGAVDRNDGLRIINSMGATYYFEPAESDTFFFSTDDRQEPHPDNHGLEIVTRTYSLYINDKQHIVFENIEFWGGKPDDNGFPGCAIYLFDCEGLIFRHCATYNGAFYGYHVHHCSIEDFFCANGLSLLGGNNVLLTRGEICNKYLNCAHLELIHNLTLRDVWIHDAFNNYYIDQPGYGWNVTQEAWLDQGRTHGLQICGHSSSSRAHNITLDRVCITRTHDGFHPYLLDTVNIYNCVFNSSCINGPLNLPDNLQRINIHNCTSIQIRNCLFLNSSTETTNSKGVCLINTDPLEVNSDYNCFCHCRIHNIQNVWRVSSDYKTLVEVQNEYSQELHSFEINDHPLPVVCDEPPEQTDYHLYAGSILIDAGDPDFPIPPNGGSCIDIGGYEYEQTGIKLVDQYRLPVLSVYPNPFSDNVNFRIIHNPLVPHTISIYDACGMKLDEIKIDANKRCGCWHPGSLPTGIYFAQWDCGSRTTVKKVILVR